MKHGWLLAVLPLVAALYLAVRRNTQKKREFEELKAKEELLSNIKQFSGYFHPIFQAAQMQNIQRTQKHLDNWYRQAAGFKSLKHYLDPLFGSEKSPLDIAVSLMEIWTRWGIQHDFPGSLFSIADKHEALYLFDDVYETGEQARVVRPAWWIQTEDRIFCIETGIAEIEN